jgi:Protein of unknown function (DUF2569)
MNGKNELVGLHGWLVVVGFGVVLRPFIWVYSTYSLYSEAINAEGWSLISDPSSPGFQGGLVAMVYGEVVVNLLFLAACIYQAILFFSCKKWFPMVFIWLLVLTTFFILADSWLAHYMWPDTEIFDADTAKNLSRVIVPACIWIPYMLLSKRVKATFTH